MAPKKRLGKKHRQAATRPRKGRAARAAPATGAVAPRKRKALSAKRAELEKKRRTPTRAPENEARRTLSARGAPPKKPVKAARPSSFGEGLNHPDAGLEADDLQAWQRAESIAGEMHTAAGAEETTTVRLPLIAICGRPNVGKSTLFNRLTGSRRSIVGDEPGITRDRIYGEFDWDGRRFRLVDTGGIIPDDPELIPTEIFNQAKVALEEADALVLVVDARTELARPDYDLVRLLGRGSKPVFLAVNKVEGEAMAYAAENFRKLGLKQVFP